MRRIINRTRRTRSSSRSRSNSNFNNYQRTTDNIQDTITDQQNNTLSRSTKKTSPVKSIGFLLILGAIVGGGFWYGSKTDDRARQESPEAVVEQFMLALGNNNENSAKNYVQTTDSAILAELSSLFDNYGHYFIYDDDYINWVGTTYNQNSLTDTEAQIKVTGTAQIVEVEIEIFEDYDGNETEDRTEYVVDEYGFSEVVFDLKKVDEEWFLANIPEKVF